MTKSVKKSQPTYAELKNELDQVLVALQDENIDVDEAIRLHKRGLELIAALEKYLKTAENSIKELKATFE